jgi:hypothetical protein
MFDAEIAADGNTLFVVDGEFAGGPHPKSAAIAIAARDGAEFRRVATSAELLKNVNTAALEYAPAVSSDLLELFFHSCRGVGPTGDISERPPQRCRAVRAAASERSPDSWRRRRCRAMAARSTTTSSKAAASSSIACLDREHFCGDDLPVEIRVLQRAP